MSLKHITLEQIIQATKNSNSAAEAARLLNIPDTGNTCTRLKNKIIKNNLDISHWSGNLWSKGKTALDDPRLKKNIPNEEIFIKNSKASFTYIRKLVIVKNLLEYKCQLCSIEPFWNNKQLNFQLDHINGNRRDQRIINLRWLCPNCHSQTETYCGKNVNKKSNKERETPIETWIEALKNEKNVYRALLKMNLCVSKGNYQKAIKIKEQYGL